MSVPALGFQAARQRRNPPIALYGLQEQTMETTSLGLTLFLTFDVIASIALAVWLGAHVGGGHSDWDR
ncbi:MAG: hypothetical protein Q7J29_05410 [Stagnimonas sp.]|nr:hypothetical protein [Stagnimonas sp.]